MGTPLSTETKALTSRLRSAVLHIKPLTPGLRGVSVEWRGGVAGTGPRGHSAGHPQDAHRWTFPATALSGTRGRSFLCPWDLVQPEHAACAQKARCAGRLGATGRCGARGRKGVRLMVGGLARSLLLNPSGPLQWQETGPGRCEHSRGSCRTAALETDALGQWLWVSSMHRHCHPTGSQEGQGCCEG